MNRPARIVLASVLLLGLLQAAPVAARTPKSTPEERAKALQLTRELERDPAVQDGPEKRFWLIEFFSRVPDITVTLCDLLGPTLGEEQPYFPQVVGQYFFSMGVYVIEHPDKAKNEIAKQTAGVEGALRVYEFYAKTQPRLPFLDDLLKRRDAGTLGEYVKDAVPKCFK